VLGTGIDICYPKENKKLSEQVLERGAIISEFPVSWHPARDWITARLAMEFGAECLACRAR
jgi:DNA processing protein